MDVSEGEKDDTVVAGDESVRIADVTVMVESVLVDDVKAVDATETAGDDGTI